jgi:carboxyl-terminal processing protease
VKRFKTLADFQKNFRLSLDEILPGLRARALADYEEPLGKLPARLRPELSLFFRAQLARQLFGNSAFYEVLNTEDDIVLEALRLMEQPNPMATARE